MSNLFSQTYSAKNILRKKVSLTIKSCDIVGLNKFIEFYIVFHIIKATYF